MSLEDLKYTENNNTISIPEYLIRKKLANRSNESFASKVLLLSYLFFFK